MSTTTPSARLKLALAAIVTTVESIDMTDPAKYTKEQTTDVVASLQEVQKALQSAFPAVKAMRKDLFSLAPATDQTAE